MSESEIMNDLSNILSDFQGRSYSGTIGPDTRFFSDLGLASIDAVVLGESLQEHYGTSLPFDELMAELGTRTDRDLPLGMLAAFLARHLGNDGSSSRKPVSHRRADMSS